MGTTLKKLTSNLKDLQIEGIDGADLILKGVKLLVEHADSPWAELIKGIFPPAPFVIGLLKAIQLKKPKFDLDTCTALAIQQAYLDVFQTNLKEEKGTLEARFDLDNVEFDKKWRKTLETSVEKLMEYEIDATQVDFPNLHNEPLAKNHLEQVAANWLKMRLFRQQNEEIEAINFARRISYQLYPQLLRIVAEHGELYAPLVEYLEKVDHRQLRELRDIEKYKAYLMKLPLKPVFNETFALKDLYVELDATNITRSSRGKFRRIIDVDDDEQVEEEKTAQLMQTVLDQLEDREHVVFIQAGPGKGKSVFCQMLAARVAVEQPDWIPVFVRLRDDRFVADQHIEEGVKEYLKPYFTLTDDLLRNGRFLFILDGFDELWLSAESSHALKFFFERISNFQRACAEENRWSHKIIITGRPMRIQNFEAELPPNFLRLKIENMGNPQFEKWLDNWIKLFNKRTANDFRAFLRQGRVFEESEGNDHDSMRSLASEPLLLYMLGAMHRDGVLTQEVLETSRRIEVYDQAVSWVCGDTKGGKYQIVHRGNRVLEKSGVQPYELRQLLQETALCVWHGGRDYAPIPRIQKRLSDFAPEQTRKLFASGFEGVHNLLASFYFQRHEGDSGNVEFSHKSFGEYLTAERMVDALMQIGERIPNRYSRRKEFRIKDIKEVANLFYSVFGAALLTDEIRDFIINIIIENLSKEEIKHITERLYRLYIEYSDGRWMDEGITKTQWDELKRHEVDVGLLRFEAQIGINLFILLCVLYQQIDETFDICGKKIDGTFDRNRFRKFFGFSEIGRTYGFIGGYIYRLLKKVNLQEANLMGVVLWGADLQGANLQDADLVGVDLRGVNLQGANLQGASLQGADLRDTNLQGANLECINLQDKSLRFVILRDTKFQDADVTDAKMSRRDLAKYRGLFSDKQIAQLNVVEE